MALIAWLLIGLVAGAVARLVVPGRDPMGLLGTLVLGLVGSLIGGWLGVVFTHRTIADFTAAGLLGSILGAIVALIVYRLLQPHGRVTGRRGARI
ncbi:MAG: GlsB/YeaQ/YmgE family stress response membrane protein [Actinobacteria bacterium]|nr:MAG: GlsB/YeaQ/YmgE family stress response membrane protein [Actinomycetota bacterium]